MGFVASCVLFIEWYRANNINYNTESSILTEREFRSRLLENISIYTQVVDSLGIKIKVVTKGKTTLELSQLEKRLKKFLQKLPVSSPMDFYTISSHYGMRLHPILKTTLLHSGIDLVNKIGYPIYPTAPGTVTYAGYYGDYGYVVDVEHFNGIVTRYAHLREVLVKKNQKVSRNVQIGSLGSTGRSTGPHLHYEIIINDQPVNPLKFILIGRDLWRYL